MKQAVWNGAILAEAKRTVKVEGNDYFPPDSLRRAYFRDSATTTHCAWKGTAHYYTVVVNGQSNPDAAWYYPETSTAASNIRDHVAFWHGVEIRNTGRRNRIETAAGGQPRPTPRWRRWFGGP